MPFMSDGLCFAAGDALVVGASRGLGLALARMLLAEHQPERLFLTYRGTSVPEDLQRLQASARLPVELLACELTCDEDLAALQSSLRTADAKLGLTLHAAGILHETQLRPEKALSQVRRAGLARLFEVNSIGPILLAQAVMSRIPRHEPAHFAALSAMVGSIGDNRMGGWFGYRASKTALNQLLRTLAIEGRRTHPALCITSIHPGTTDTDLSRPFQSGVSADKLYHPDQSARRILQVVLAGTPEESGRFMNWNGSALPW